MNLAQVYQLIDRDSGEEIDHGQTVRETFPLADFFLRVDSDSDQPIKTKLNRFLNIIFGIEICTYINGGKCFNDSMKSQISEDIVKDLIEANLIEKNKLSETVLAIQNSKIKDLIEFSRSIHAEMHAIIIGSQIAGNRIREGKLYCT